MKWLLIVVLSLAGLLILIVVIGGFRRRSIPSLAPSLCISPWKLSGI